MAFLCGGLEARAPAGVPSPLRPAPPGFRPLLWQHARALLESTLITPLLQRLVLGKQGLGWVTTNAQTGHCNGPRSI